MTNNEMIASLAAFFLRQFKDDAAGVAEEMDMNDDELKQLIKYCEEFAALQLDFNLNTVHGGHSK